MNLTNLDQAPGEFRLLETTGRSQTAVMRLEPGESTSDEPNHHPHSDQVLLVLEGELDAEVNGEKRRLKKGDAVTVAAGVGHRFTNAGEGTAVGFSVYAPPAYQTDDPT